MLSIDTNILLHAFNEDSPNHKAAHGWLMSIQRNEEVAILVPHLLELFSPDFLVDFMKNIGHENSNPLPPAPGLMECAVT